jgi:hypothetical protein
MGVTYFKRYRMEIDLAGRDFSGAVAPPGYLLLPWDAALLEAHAEVKYRAFCGEIDANVFTCLSSYAGCLRLMDEIVRKPRFLAEATWLAVYRHGGEADYCGTVQGIQDTSGLGAIQNLGITPEHRGTGLGTVLMHRSLDGFRRMGLRRAYLEVTAQNDGAIRLYERMGFCRCRTAYKAVEVVCT